MVIQTKVSNAEQRFLLCYMPVKDYTLWELGNQTISDYFNERILQHPTVYLQADTDTRSCTVVAVDQFDCELVDTQRFLDYTCGMITVDGEALYPHEVIPMIIDGEMIYVRKSDFVFDWSTYSYTPETTGLSFGYVTRYLRGYYSDNSREVDMPDDEQYMNWNIAEARGWRYCDVHEEYYQYNEGCAICYDNDDSDNDDNRIAEYHSLERKYLSSNAEWHLGIEVEKVDEEEYEDLNYRDYYGNMGWCIETDGSLNDCGWEMVSPAMDLFDDEQINAVIKSGLNLIRANSDSSCGGHMHVSSQSLSAESLFDELQFWFPLFYALYPHRAMNSYSKAMKKDVQKAQDKYGAITPRRELHTVEFRIFPSPRNENILWWRIQLLRIIVKKPIKSYFEMMDILTDVNSELFAHLTKVYNTPGKYLAKLNLIIKMVKEIEAFDLKVGESIEKVLSESRYYKSKKGELLQCA